MGNYLQTYGIIRRQFHRSFAPVATFGLLQARRAFSSLGLLLDNAFYRRYRAIDIQKPVFIIGNPRSGTTFLHKLLESTRALCGFQLWEMMFPAITSRKILSPFVDRMSALSPARHHASEAHETGLHDLETDDVLEFLNFFDGGFLWSYFLAWEDQWGSEQCRRYFDPALRSRSKSERLFKYLEGCWRRNMHYKGRDRIVAKSSMLTLRIEDLVARYPDCRLIYAVRDPRDTIPSGMSLLSSVLDRAYDAFNRADVDAQAQYNENLYRASCHLYERFHQAKEAGVIPAEQLFVVPFPRLMNDLEQVSAELLDFIEVEPPQEYLYKIALKSKKQKSFKSGHSYSLEQYGLDEERVRKDLSFVYSEYDVAPASREESRAG